MIIKLKIAFVFIIFGCQACSQKTVRYNLAQMLAEKKLMIDTSNHAQVLHDHAYQNAISTQKILWLKDVSFKEGTIEIDLRGKDVFLQSFLGIAFHAKNSQEYEVVYFRPFNFRHPDTARRRWSVQYMVVPGYPWDKLRKEDPLIFENALTPVPMANAWFHATIIVTNDSVTVYVNHSSKPSLSVKKLGDLRHGMIGLWDDELSGDFSNLTVTGVKNKL